MTLKSLLFVAAMTGIALAAAEAVASPFAYATNYRQELFKIDLNSPGSLLIGNIGFTAEGLAATSSGQLFATDATGKLHDVTGGGNVLVANLGAVSVGSMDSAGSTLWGYDNASQRLFEYDPGTSSFLQWSSVLGMSNVKALTIDSSGDFLFITKQGLTDKFGKITNGTWATTLINPSMTLSDNCEAMDFLADGNLYAAVLGDVRYQLDPTTGNAISGFYSGVHRDWADMTAATPEPATFAILAIGAGLLRRRRK